MNRRVFIEYTLCYVMTLLKNVKIKLKRYKEQEQKESYQYHCLRECLNQLVEINQG